MTNMEKQDLRAYCKRGLTFKEIRPLVDCSDGTIRQYLKVFAPKPNAPLSNLEGRDGG